MSFSLHFSRESVTLHFPFPQTSLHCERRTPFPQIRVPSLSFFLPIFFKKFSLQEILLGFIVLVVVVIMMVKKPWCCEWIVLCALLFAAAVSSKNHDNPANDLVDIINKNRTAQRLSLLNNSPGLGCMALQYVEECKGNCTANNTINCRPLEVDFTEVFAPNCGVELPTFGTISGHIVGCQHKYLQPSEAFSLVLVRDKKTLSLVSNKTHTEVGVGYIGNHKGGYYWCVLFSSSQRNTTFVLEDLGKGIEQKKGCYSGSSIPCSRGQKSTSVFSNNIFFMCFLYIYLLEHLWSNL